MSLVAQLDAHVRIGDCNGLAMVASGHADLQSPTQKRHFEPGKG
jgi:hypothetical protein